MKQIKEYWNKIEETTLLTFIFRYYRYWLLFFWFYFQTDHGFIQEGNPSEKVVIIEQELYMVLI